MLVAKGSLDALAKAYGIPESKGYLPHGYFQNCDSHEQILERIYMPVKWTTLAPHIDWFHDSSMSELQHRALGRTYEEWIEEQGTRKEYLRTIAADPDAICDMPTAMAEYLDKDVDCLFQVVEAMGNYFWTNSA